MFTMPPGDITSPTTKGSAAEVRPWEGTALPTGNKKSVFQDPDATLFVAFESLVPSLQGSRDLTQFEAESRPQTSDFGVETAEIRSARDTRLALLARKYVSGNSTPEDSARMHIATARLRALLPRVTEKDLLDLEDIVGEVSALDPLLEGIRARFGLKNK